MFCNKIVAQAYSSENIYHLDFDKVEIFSNKHDEKKLLELSKGLHCPFLVTDNALVFKNVKCFPQLHVEDEYVENQKNIILNIVKLFLVEDIKTVVNSDDEVGMALREFVYNAIGSSLSAAYINDIVDKGIQDVTPSEYAKQTKFNEKTKIVVEKVKLSEDGKMKIMFSNFAPYSATVVNYIEKRLKFSENHTKIGVDGLAEIDEDTKGFSNITGRGKLGVHMAATKINMVGHLEFSCQKDNKNHAWYEYTLMIDRKHPWYFKGLPKDLDQDDSLLGVPLLN